MIDSKILCPVCGTMKTDGNKTCSNCHFGCAYFTLFSGENAYNVWRSLVDTHKGKFVGQSFIDKRNKGSELLVTSDRICFFDAGNSQAIIVEFNKNEPQVLKNIKQVSLSGLYRVWLNENGTLGSSGDDEAGQRSLSSLIEIINIATTPGCTYAVRADGTVTSRGATPFREDIATWNNIKSLCCADHIIGLKNDKTIVYAIREGSLFSSYAPVMRDWKNVKKIASTEYYAIALCEDGSVLYAGANDSKSQCTSWNNIVDIAADGQYVIGLTRDGNVLLAGESSPIIDFGRSEARNWKDVVFIAAGRSLIAGITKNGDLKVVGNIIKCNDMSNNFINAIQSMSMSS